MPKFSSETGIVIPRGKQIRIHQGNQSVVSRPMVLDEPITLNFNSNFGPLIDTPGTKWLNVIGAGLRDISKGKIAFSGQFKQFGFQVWESTDPIILNVTVTFRIDKTEVDAEEQVLKPTQELCKIPLPSEGELGGSNLIPPGPSVLTVIKGEEQENKAGWNSYSIEIGRVLRIPMAIIKKAEPTYANECDERGYPIWSKVNLDIQSVFVATQEQVNNVPRYDPTQVIL